MDDVGGQRLDVVPPSSVATPRLETPRLILRPIDLADADQVQRIFPRWEIVEFMSDRVPWPYPADGARAFIRDVALPASGAGREWTWSIRRRDEPTRLIGLVSVRTQPDNNRGFWLDPQWQRLGLMAEASDAVTHFWFDVLDQPVLRVPKAVANVRSRRISERTGMRVVATFEKTYLSGRQPAELWEITRAEWRARRGDGAGPTSR